MAENAYEGMFIIDSNRYGRDPGGLANQISDLITKRGGTILVSRLWEERRLAYPINGQRKGTYWLTYFRMDSKELATLNRETHLNENVLRSLVLKVDSRLIDTLVAHAKAGPAEATKVRRPEPVVAAVPAGAGEDIPDLGNDVE
ncbi:MAG TPA: 30S ribosomal protein S6 [Pirellulales bacterium]|nr:30S ribosomal protein S6 [Pirellulales bacterium]